MTHLMAVDNTDKSVTNGLEVMIPVTIIETNPMRVAAARVYKKGYFGKQTQTDIWASELPDLDRRITPPKKEKKPDFAAVKKDLDAVEDVRLLAYTLPKKTHAPKKTPDLMEIALTGPVDKKLDYASDKLGKELTLADTFEANQYVDVTAVTKGKGFQGIIKRWNNPKQPRKATKRTRHMGSGGAWTPTKKLWTEPQAGQMGYHTRTEYNKIILDVGEKGDAVTPAGGFLHYGPVAGNYVVVKGSIPGPAKRLIRLTPARRPPKKTPSYEITEVNTDSKQ